MDQQINADGAQSFHLNTIKNELREGRNVSHILNVKLSNQQGIERGNAIRQAIYKKINSITITKVVNNRNVDITWKSSATQTSAYYYTDVEGFYGDVAVKTHTAILLSDLLNQLRPVFGEISLAFLVTRPLVREVALD
jgi:hypothetical protein